MAPIHRLAELRPEQLVQQLERFPVAILPWGAIEWHGPHLPYGLDGLVAEAFCERLATDTGAVMLPTTYLPITSLPHPHSISIRTEIVRGAWEDLFQGLGSAGFRVVCLVSGHYAQGHELVLTEVAEAASQGGGPLVLAGSPLALMGEPSLLDHAGRWETSQLLAIRPELVKLDALPRGRLPPPSQAAVLGEDPRKASAEQGQAIIRRALEAWSGWIDRLIRGDNHEALFELYAERRAGYQDYLDQYFAGSWDDAIQAWWQELGG